MRAPLISLQATADETVGRLGVRTPTGWVAMAEQGGGTLGRFASEQRFLLVGQRESSITQRIRLWNLPDEADSTAETITRAQRSMHLASAWDDFGLQLRYHDDENFRLGLRILGLNWTTEQLRLDQPRQIFPIDGITVALSYASLQKQATEISYSGWPLPYPIHELGAGIAQWEWESVTRFAQDGYTARVRFNGDLEARWGWLETRTRWFDSNLRVVWLSTETIGTVSSNSFPSLSEDLNPLEFTDALLGSLRLSRRWRVGEKAQLTIWAEQWLPIALWGEGNTFDFPPPDDEPGGGTPGKPGEPGDPSEEPSAPEKKKKDRPHSGLFLGVSFRF